jgi:hypothetical protein
VVNFLLTTECLSYSRLGINAIQHPVGPNPMSYYPYPDEWAEKPVLGMLRYVFIPPSLFPDM